MSINTGAAKKAGRKVFVSNQQFTSKCGLIYSAVPIVLSTIMADIANIRAIPQHTKLRMTYNFILNSLIVKVRFSTIAEIDRYISNVIMHIHKNDTRKKNCVRTTESIQKPADCLPYAMSEVIMAK
ncbi:hypothetical protein NPIL_253151 [Nephila pilipes]|uniref:Uncharacterized protein n=1 Tax=Nephila pilipes TaxID=299642 RepID=A0A8X6TBN0_NEPPI|nr:hypothetical protein NPIL_253151 [Nephila pilipes]